jgi:hypothetical protein
MPLVTIARILAVVWVLLSVGVYFLMLNGFTPQQALILLLWVAAPLPLAYWIGGRVAATPRAWAAIVVGLALAFAFGAWLYWDAFLGPSSRTESLSGLVVLHGPLYQTVILAVALLTAWRLSRPGARSAA